MNIYIDSSLIKLLTLKFMSDRYYYEVSIAISLLYILLSSFNIKYISPQRALQQAEKHIDLSVGVS